MRTQFNVRIAKRLKRLIELDRKSSNRTNDIIAEVALDHFFSSLQPGDRIKFYRNHDRVPYAKASK